MNKSLNITFVLPVIDETLSLRKTVDTIFELAEDNLHEIIIVIADKTTEDSAVVIKEIKNTHPYCVHIHKQKLPFLGGAMREAFDIATGDHIMLMASDLETDPKLIPKFIETMRKGNWDIVAGSRWIKGGGFEGYNKLKLVLNYLFQKIFRILYNTKLTDLTFAYRLYRKSILKDIIWEELKHPFLLECIIKPLRCRAKVVEIPCKWQTRSEGKSANTFLATFRYLRIALKSRFIPLSRISKMY
jgi:glycosyltransferase involved in cell wall biosynthesis